jgi:hypothetical protein
LKGAGQAEPHHHRHQSDDQETGSPGQLKQDAAKLLNDLPGNIGSSGAASTVTASAADATNGISASYFGAYRAYSNADAKPTVPTQLGLA